MNLYAVIIFIFLMRCKMDDKKRFAIFSRARKKCSEIAQAMVLMEECGELISSTSQYYRGRDDMEHVVEEIADVMICCEQIIFNMCRRHKLKYHDVENMVRDIKEQKLNRLHERLR